MASESITAETAVCIDAEPAADGPAPVRTRHRIAPGTTIRELLIMAGAESSVTGIAAGTLGLSRHGRRAWLDDVVQDHDRIEVVAPVVADAKAARFERVARDRARRSGR